MFAYEKNPLKNVFHSERIQEVVALVALDEYLEKRGLRAVRLEWQSDGLPELVCELVQERATQVC